MTREDYETIIKFLDIAKEATTKHAEELSDLNRKVIYHRHAEKLFEARRTLLKEIFAFEDWLETNTYEVPEIRFSVIQTPIETI